MSKAALELNGWEIIRASQTGNFRLRVRGYFGDYAHGSLAFIARVLSGAKPRKELHPTQIREQDDD